MNTQAFKRPPLPEIRAVAAGKWHAILTGLGIPETYLNPRKHTPCPSCDGRDRYRFTDYQQNGGFICNQCTPEGGSGFDLVMLAHGCDFGEAAAMVSDWLGLTEHAPKSKQGRRNPPRHAIITPTTHR